MVSATKLMGMASLASGSLFWGGPALADDSSVPGLGRPEPATEEVVSDLLDHAATAFDEGSFKEASDYYRAALRLSPSRATLCNLGVAARLAGNVTEAVQAMSECLAEPLPPLAPGDEDERARRIQFRGDLEVLRQQTGSLEVTTTPGAEVVIDDLPRGAAPLAPIFVLPGAHTVMVRDARGEARRSVEVGAGKRVTIALEPKGATTAPKAQRAAPVVLPPAPEKSDALPPLVVAGIVVTSVAYAAGLATLTTAFVTGGDLADDLKTASKNPQGCSAGNLSKMCADVPSRQRTIQTLQAASLASFLVTAVVGVGTLTYGLKRGPAPGPTVSVNTTGFTLGWRGTW